MGTTSAQKKLFFNLRKLKGRIGALEDGDLRPENVSRIATELKVSEDEVISMNRRMSGGDSSLNTKINSDGESDAEWQDWLEDEAADHVESFESKEELNLRRSLLVKAMSDLTEREKEIISSRQLSDEPKTLEELSRVFKVSRERVRQIEVKAFEKLREKINILNKEKLKV
jgi:RNA polymerase sigma-32 factor